MGYRTTTDRLLDRLTQAINTMDIAVDTITVNTEGLETLLSDGSGSKALASGTFPVGRAIAGVDAENAAVSANPALVGGRYDSSNRTLGNGDAGAIALNVRGEVIVDNTAMVTDLAAIEVTQNRMVAPTSTVYLTGTKAFTGPFYAITALTETVIDVSEGNTNIVESDDSGSMQATASNLTIPAGVSIYGNFAVVELDSGTAIGYAGAGVTVTVAGS